MASVMVMIALTFLGVANLYQTTTASRAVANEIYKKKAFYLAEAGIESAMWQVDNDEDWSDGTPADYSDNLGDGSFNVVFSSRTEDSIQIESTGIINTIGGQVTRTIKVKAAR